MDYKTELKITFLSYMSGQIEYEELDKRIEKIFSKAVYEELRKKGVIEWSSYLNQSCGTLKMG